MKSRGCGEQERRTRAEPAAFRDLRAAQLAAQSRKDANLQSLLSAVQITPPDGPSARVPLSRRAKADKDSPPGTPPSERQSGLDTVSYHGSSLALPAAPLLAPQRVASPLSLRCY